MSNSQRAIFTRIMKHVITVVFWTGLLCASAVAKPDDPAPEFDYVRPTKGGDYVFVMLRPKTFRSYAYDYVVYADSATNKRKNVDGRLFEKYPESGLYRTGSTQPLWTVDWYSFGVRACSDGVHLVRFGPWAESGDEGKTLAVAFYRSGKKIRSYAVRDLISNYKELPHTTSHYSWRKSDGFDDAGKRLRIETLIGYDYQAGRSLFFDIRTGLPIHQMRTAYVPRK